MKNITAQYKDLLEGKMSKANFMNNVRQQFPDYIHPVNSYQDMISILKSKRIITEGIHDRDITSSAGMAGHVDPKHNDDAYARMVSKPIVKDIAKNMSDSDFQKLLQDFGYEEFWSGDVDATIESLPTGVLRDISWEYMKPGSMREDTVSNLKGKRIIPENEDWEKESRANQYGINPYGQGSNINDLIQDVKDYMTKGYNYEEAIEYIAAENDMESEDLAMMVPKDVVDVEGHEEEYDDDGIGAWEGKQVTEGYDEEGEEHSLAIQKDLEDRFKRNEIDQQTFYNAIDYVADHDYDLYVNNEDAEYVLQQVTGVAETYLNEALAKPEGSYKRVTGKQQYDVFDEIDRVNPYEFRKGVTIEMGMQNLPTPNTFTDKFNPEAIEKATKKVLKNLAKDPAYYTNMISAITEKRTKLPQEAKEIKTRPDGKIKVKGFNDAKSNTELTLSKRERAKGKPEGVKEMKPSGKSMGGIKTMKSNGKVPKGVEMMKENSNLTEAIKEGDKVKIDPEVFPNINDPKKQVYSMPDVSTKLSPDETYTVTKISGTDAVLIDANGKKAGYVNIEFLIPQRTSVPGEIFGRNQNITTGLNKLAGLQEIQKYVASQIKKDLKRK